MEVLLIQMIDCTLDVNEFRKSVYDYVSKNRDKIHTNLAYRRTTWLTGKMKEKSDEFIEEKVMTRIWPEGINFTTYADIEYWVHSSYILPIFEQIYNINVL